MKRVVASIPTIVVFEETRRRCRRINTHFNHVHEPMQKKGKITNCIMNTAYIYQGARELINDRRPEAILRHLLFKKVTDEGQAGQGGGGGSELVRSEGLRGRVLPSFQHNTGKGPFQTSKAHLQLHAADHSQLCHFLKHTVHRAYQKFSIEKFIM